MALLEHYQDVFLALHIIAISIAIGAATVHDIAFYQQIKFFDSEKWNSRTFNISKTLIFSAIFWILFSGLALFWPNKEKYLESPVFILKIAITAIVFLNSFILYQFVLDKVASSLKYSQGSKPEPNFIRKIAFIMSGISLSSWFSIAALSSLRQTKIEFNTLLAFYLGLIAIAIVMGLYSEYKFSKRFKTRSIETLKDIAKNLLSDISERITALNKN